MPSSVFSFSVRETDLRSLERIERLALHANTKGVSLSYVILLALKHYEEEIDTLWQPRTKKQRLKNLV